MPRAVIVIATALSLLAAPARAAGTKPLLFRDVRIFDGAVVTHGDVLIDQGVIRAIGPKLSAKGAEVIDGAARTLLPGFIDAHTHAYEDKALKQALIFGVTTELEMFGDPAKNRELRQREERRESTGQADLRSSGILATAPKGHGTEYGFPIPTLSTPGQAAAFVDDRIKDGSDYLKIVLDDGKWFGRGIPTLDAPTVAALVHAAHERHKIAVVHIGSQAGARTALDAGGDGLAHLFIDSEPAPDFAAFVAAHHAFVIPTLGVLTNMCDGGTPTALANDPAIAPFLDERDLSQLARTFPRRLPPTNCAYALAAVKQLAAAHVPLLAGTDALNPGVVHGASLHRELELLVQAGLSPVEALVAATSAPAARFSLGDRGRIARSLRADLVLVDGDPTIDVRRTRNIVGVWKRGVAVDRDAYRTGVEQQRAETTRERATPPPPGSESGHVADFEDTKLTTRFGAGLAPSTDALRGGSSTVELKVTAGGARGSKHALVVTGETKGDSGFAWAGVIFSPGSAPMTPANLSSKKTLRFFAKGDGKRYRVMLFARHLGFLPLTRTFVAGPQWTEVTMALSDFDGVDGRDVMGILWTGGPAPESFSFSIDEIDLR
jgi:imidazolonepropionase-like amidohydrolase